MALLCCFQNRSLSIRPHPPGDSCVFAQSRKYGILSPFDKPERRHVIYAGLGSEHEHEPRFMSTSSYKTA